MKAVVKIGGTLLETAADRLRIAEMVARQVRAGHRILLVHGGGKQLTQFLDTMGVASRFVDGFRVTTAETLDGVIKVFAGTVNHELLAAFCRVGLPAVGLSGIDAGGLIAEKLQGERGQDWGFVGQIRKVNPAVWETLLEAGFLPVLACLAVGEDGQIYNVNADQAAVACAVHSWRGRADALVFLTDVDGVRDGEGRALARLGAEEIPALLRSGVVTGGMLAKLNAVREALAQAVPSVYIGNGHRDDALDSVFAAGKPSHEAAVAGTVITPSLTASSSEGKCGSHWSEGGHVA
ncbi:MAG: acetylglutamate kinase [Acidobacteria bacterium RIFCSPLOWO2_02_FULL_61_28]|nr:MAG: acetylglutamate kinase [Acidobacteria bacterium RIFCSPLOWO2_02_FULL_61_28]